MRRPLSLGKRNREEADKDEGIMQPGNKRARAVEEEDREELPITTETETYDDEVKKLQEETTADKPHCKMIRKIMKGTFAKR